VNEDVALPMLQELIAEHTKASASAPESQPTEGDMNTVLDDAIFPSTTAPFRYDPDKNTPERFRAAKRKMFQQDKDEHGYPGRK
jgi:hypothetical protein